MASSSSKNSSPPVELFDVVDNITDISIEIYTYLQPAELCRLSLCSLAFSRNVEGVRHKVLRAHLPIRLCDDVTKDTICLSEGHTFTEKSNLQAFMVQKFDAAGILVRDTRTREHSTQRAKHLLNYQNWCHLTLPEHTFNALAECHVGEIDPNYATRMLGWNDCKGVIDQHSATYEFVAGWARYLLAERNVRSSRWNWISSHPNLRGQSVRGTGIAMTTPRGELIEIRWDKKFKLTGSILDSNLHRRRRRE